MDGVEEERRGAAVLLWPAASERETAFHLSSFAYREGERGPLFISPLPFECAALSSHFTGVTNQ